MSTPQWLCKYPLSRPYQDHSPARDDHAVADRVWARFPTSGAPVILCACGHEREALFSTGAPSRCTRSPPDKPPGASHLCHRAAKYARCCSFRRIRRGQDWGGSVTAHCDGCHQRLGRAYHGPSGSRFTKRAKDGSKPMGTIPVRPFRFLAAVISAGSTDDGEGCALGLSSPCCSSTVLRS